jgi:hypothetical protein
MFVSQASKRSRSARQGWARHKARMMVSEGIPALFQPRRQAANARRRSQRRRRSGLL